MAERVRLATGRGPLGTGIFLLGRRPAGAEVWLARPWVCFLTLPLLPLRPARFRGPWVSTASQTWEVERERLPEPARGDVAKTLLGALGGLVLALGPGWYAWTAIHQTGLLEALRVVVGAAAPILVLARRDLSAPRVLR